MEDNNIVIGIEGFVGAGKTSICRELLKYIPNSVVLHAGNVYRAVVYRLMQEKNLDISNLDIKELMEKYNINLKVENGETVVYFGDEKIDIKILQSDEVSLAVSKVAKVAKNNDAYKVVCDIIKKLKKKYNVIFSGRDTMKIYNGLDYHFFITADIDERVRRKRIQYGNKIDEKTLKDHIEKRDILQKESGYYNTYESTIVIDVTKCKSVEESTKEVLKHIKLKELV